MTDDSNAAKKTEDTKPTVEETTEEPKKSLIETAPNNEVEEEEYDEFEHPAFFCHVNKVHFIAMCDILHSLSAAFMPGKDDKPDYRFEGAWHACLAIAGWEESEFWQAYELEEACPVCGGDMGGDDEDDEELPEIVPTESVKKPLPN